MPKDWEWWHWFWAKVFGQRVPTSGDRAHIDDLMLVYRPDNDEWWRLGAGTDANRVHKLGNLYIFDYGDTPLETKETETKLNFKRDRKRDAAELLAENKREWQCSPMASDFGDPKDPESHRQLRAWVKRQWQHP